MIGERFCFYIGSILLKRQPSGVYQMLDLVFKGQTFFSGVTWGFPMVRASCVMIIPFWEMMLVDLPGSYYGHLVGDEGRQEVFVRHWDRGEFWNWLRGKVPHRVGTGTKVGIAGRASRGWSQSLGSLPLDGGGRSRLYGR